MEKNQSVRCKFYCTSVAQTANAPAAPDDTARIDAGKVTQDQITLAPVYGDENKPWSKYTPCGQLQLTITNPDVIGSFTPGQAYFIDITPA